ncbi:MAG: FG-GAP-like repeat-containing protein [Vulcanimicrobiota bacterium]
MQRLLGILLILALAGCGQLETGTSTTPDPVAGLSGDGLIDYVRQGPTGSQVGLSQQAFGGERYVVFHTAEALISTDTNGMEDVYLMDLLLGNLERVSLGVGGAQPDGASNWATVSIDGRYVAFESRAENLVAADGNGHQDVFLRDRTKGQTILVSQGGDGDSFDAQLSGLGLKLMFTSAATNLVAGDTNGHLDCFLYDLAATNLVRASLDRNGNQIEGSDSTDPAISYTGNQFVFASGGTNLPLYNGFRQIYGARAKNLKPFLLSYGPGNQPGTGHSSAPSIASFAKKVVFTSEAADLVAGDSNGVADLFVFNLDAAGVTRASLDSSGNQLNGPSTVGALSGDGTQLAFITEASGAASGDGDTQPDAILKDLTTGQTTLVSRDSSGTKANGASGGVSVSLSGARAVFGTLATNLQPFDTTNDGDIYVHQPDVGNTILASQAFQPSTGFAGRRSLSIEYSTIPETPDLNKDGFLDMVWSDATGEIQVALGQSDGFAEAISPGFTGSALAVDKFDGDTYPDLAYLNGSEVRLALGDGAGGFGPSQVVATLPSGFGVWEGLSRLDANHDGIPDLVTQQRFSNQFGALLLKGDGAGAFAQATSVTLPGSAASLRTARVDGNEFPDFVSLSRDGSPTTFKLNVVLDDGTSASTDLGSLKILSYGLGDWNGDGFDDLVIGLYQGGVRLYLGDGSGTFSLADEIVTTASATEPILADVTGDLVTDLVVDLQDRLVLLRGNGVDLGIPPETVFPGSLQGPLRLVDANGDDRPDLFAVATLDLTRKGEAMVLLGTGDGSFWASSRSAGIVGLGDFLGDLLLDVAVAQSTPFVTLVPGANPGVAGFQPGIVPENALYEDFNGDGKLDILLQRSDSVGELWLGANFATNFAAPVGPGKAADLDLDGDLDLVTYDESGLKTYRNDGHGGYTLSGTLPLSGNRKFIELADLNQDGLPDLVISRTWEREIDVALNQGGSFTVSHILSAPSPPASPVGPVKVTDFNQDGKPDLLVSMVGPYHAFGLYALDAVDEDFRSPTGTAALDRVGITGLDYWGGTGTGNFFYGTHFDLKHSPDTCFEVADITGDGKLDLLVGRSSYSVVSLYTRALGGSFEHVANWISPGGLGAVGDTNGDGRFDLVGGNGSVLLGR